MDTNLYVEWLNAGGHEDLMLGRGLVRYLSAVVHMELAAGAKTLPAQRALSRLVRDYRSGGRLLVPSADIFASAGDLLRKLRSSGREVRRASLVNDVLIALSARSIGATVLTADKDFEAIGELLEFKFRRLPKV